MKYIPSEIIYCLDRPTDYELSYCQGVASALKGARHRLKIVVSNYNANFTAPVVRNIAYEYCSYEHIVSLDGDMIPTGEFFLEYEHAFEKAHVVVGRRLDNNYAFDGVPHDWREINCSNHRNIFLNDGLLTDRWLYDHYNVLWSCNFGFDRHFYESVMDFNEEFTGQRQFFDSYWTQSWGGEDSWLGYLAFLSENYVYSCHADALHQDHPTRNDSNNSWEERFKQYKEKLKCYNKET